MKRRLALSVLAAVLSVSGCGIAPNSNVLPGSVGTGDGGYRVKAEFASVGNLVPNSEIRHNNVSVGTVLDIKVKGWKAEATFSMKKGVELPANVRATIGQKSLLGAEYVELLDPVSPEGTLAAGARIGTGATGSYPGTEEVLMAVSLLLNNGGLSQIQTISTELNKAMRGRTETTRELIQELSTFSGSLEEQEGDIVRSLEAMDRLSGKLASEKKTVGRAIDRIGPGVEALNANREELKTAIDKVGRFGDVATTVVDESGEALVTDLEQLEPILAQLREAGVALPQATRLLTFPFPLENVDRVVRGDYANLWITLDVNAGVITKDFGLLDSTASLDASNPITGPIATPGGKKPSDKTSQPSGPMPAPEVPTDPGSETPTPGSSPSPDCGALGGLFGGC